MQRCQKHIMVLRETGIQASLTETEAEEYLQQILEGTKKKRKSANF